MKPTTELIKLIDKSLAHVISRTEMARLEDLLEDDANLQFYLEMASVEGALPHAFEEEPSAIIKPKFNWIQPLGIAAAAAVTFSVGLFTGKNMDAPTVVVTDTIEEATDFSATITSMVGVDWGSSSPTDLQLSSESDSVQIDSGLIELTFASGVRALIEGPAEFNVTGDNQAFLTAGRMVADVPDGAEGFTVNHAQGKLVDLGTVFAIHIPDDQSMAEVGVFSGEVELYNLDEDTPVKIFENHAMIQKADADTPFESVPFQRDSFVRYLPSHEFPWTLPEIPTSELTELSFDVSHLLWRSGDYRAVLKWMKGGDALKIESAELYLDDELITADHHTGRTGVFLNTFDNTYTLSVPENKHRKGKWTLKVKAIADNRNEILAGNFSPESSGTLLFEDRKALHAKDSDFVGTWEYHHDNDIHQRVFHADHTATYYFNGERTSIFENSHWSVDDGILTLAILPSSDPNSQPHVIIETHLLRDNDELIFVNHPYRNAKKID